jgi:hypothetical protein
MTIERLLTVSARMLEVLASADTANRELRKATIYFMLCIITGLAGQRLTVAVETKSSVANYFLKSVVLVVNSMTPYLDAGDSSRMDTLRTSAKTAMALQ